MLPKVSVDSGYIVEQLNVFDVMKDKFVLREILLKILLGRYCTSWPWDFWDSIKSVKLVNSWNILSQLPWLIRNDK